MKNKIIVFLGILGILAFSIFNHIKPLKVNAIDLNSSIHSNEYFILTIDEYDYSLEAPNEMLLYTINIPRYYGNVDTLSGNYYINGVVLRAYIKEYQQNGFSYQIKYEYSANTDLISGVFRTETIELEEELYSYMLFIYNDYNENNHEYLLYYGTFSVGTDVVKELIGSYYSFITSGNASIQFRLRQYLGNNYYGGETISGLFTQIDGDFRASPFNVIATNKYKYGYSVAISQRLSSNWLTDTFSSIGDFLAIEVFPGFQIGYLLAIPIIFGILRMILHIWKN